MEEQNSAYLRVSGKQAQELQQALPDRKTLLGLAELYKFFGDETRLRILTLLSGGELCVYDLARLLGMTDSAVSHQLRVLKQGRLVCSRRDGKTVFYSLADDHVQQLLCTGLEHILEAGKQ